MVGGLDEQKGELFLGKEALRRAGLDCEIVSLRDGAQAIEFLCGLDAVAHCPDCILLDLNLPKVRGDEVLKPIRQHPALACEPRLVWSSCLSTGTNGMLEESNLTHYVEKPLELRNFLAGLAKIPLLLTASLGR